MAAIYHNRHGTDRFNLLLIVGLLPCHSVLRLLPGYTNGVLHIERYIRWSTEAQLLRSPTGNKYIPWTAGSDFRAQPNRFTRLDSSKIHQTIHVEDPPYTIYSISGVLLQALESPRLLYTMVQPIGF